MGEEEMAVGLEIFEKFGSAWKLNIGRMLMSRSQLLNL